MRLSPIPLYAALAAILLSSAPTGHTASAALDVTSGASMGRTMVTVSAITVTTNTAALKYSEGYRNGTFRFYYTTTAFASTADTTRSTVTKMNVSPRGSGTLNLSNLTPNTTYYFRFQGYYPKGTANYWAKGSFKTEASTAIAPRAKAQGTDAPTLDALGRPAAGSTAGVKFRPGEAIAQPRETRR